MDMMDLKQWNHLEFEPWADSRDLLGLFLLKGDVESRVFPPLPGVVFVTGRGVGHTETLCPWRWCPSLWKPQKLLEPQEGPCESPPNNKNLLLELKVWEEQTLGPPGDKTKRC